MSANGVKNLIAAVDLLFPAPQYGGDKKRQAGWIAIYTDELKGFPDDVLAQVGKEIVRETKPEDGDGRFFPSVAKIRERCEAKMESLNALPLLPKPEAPHAFAPERIKLARDIMRSPLGKQARAEGWETSMFQFCMEHMKAPSGAEIEGCKRASKDFASEYEKCLKGEREFGGPLAKLAENIARKARELMDGAA
jgi:hypothetical protein